MRDQRRTIGTTLAVAFVTALMISDLFGALGAPRAIAATSLARVDNPYAGAQVYVNPEWSAKVSSAGGGAVAGQPTAVWLDRISAIDGSADAMGLRDHLDAALLQGADLLQLTLGSSPIRATIPC